MSKPHVLVLRAAGTNCDRETAYAFELAGAVVETVHINQFTRGKRRLKEFDLMAIPGGFTYGDDVSAGRILANEMGSLIADQVQEFIAAGRLVLGICNGFQVLVKAGLLPGDLLPDQPGSQNAIFERQSVTLGPNLNGRFQCRWVRLKVNEAAAHPFLAGMDGRVLEVPIAHGEGCFYAPPAMLERLEGSRQIAFQYCGPHGELDDQYNVNGSALHAAGISGHNGHVLGLMPHPERHIHGVQHPRWTREGLQAEGQGLVLFRNAVRFLQQS